jgi:hypothetical protein
MDASILTYHPETISAEYFLMCPNSTLSPNELAVPITTMEARHN